MKNNKGIKQNKPNRNISRKGLRGLRELEDGLDPQVLAKQILIKGENKRIFINYVLKMRERGVLYKKTEEELLKKYIFSGWKLRRMREIEKNLLNKQQKFEGEELWTHDLILGGKELKRRIRNLSKIEITDDIKENQLEQDRLEKQMVKALKQLREEQNLKRVN